MKEYAKLSNELKESITIYMLSSSVSQINKDQSEINREVWGFLTKPLKMETVLEVSTIKKSEILEDRL